MSFSRRPAVRHNRGRVSRSVGSAVAFSLLLSAAPGGRYFQNASGTPVFLFGDSAWSAITNLTAAEQDIYLDDRQARGVNCLVIQFLENQFGPAPPQDRNGNLPFVGVAFQSALNEPYWVNVDLFMAKCSARGILCLVNPAYIGRTNAEGWGTEVTAASAGQMTSFGATLGTRYAGYDGIIWCLYGDRKALDSKMDNLAAGIASTDTRHTLYTAHYARAASTHDAAVPTWVTCDFWYPDTARAHVEGDTTGAAGVGFFGEGRYENSTAGGTPFAVRREAWQAALSNGLGGIIVGNEAIWAFGYNSLFPAYNGGANWQLNLGDLGLIHSKFVADLFNAIDFTSLVSEAQSATFVTAGRGTYASNTWVPVSRNAANTLAAAYIPAGGLITVAASLMAAPFYADWYDPTAGTYTPATGSQPFANSGTRNFTASSERGNNAAGGTDWVLLLRTNP